MTVTRIDATTTLAVEHGPFTVRIDATTEIDAAPETVWAILTDTARYPAWNPFIARLDGVLVAGRRITVRLELPGRTPRTMRPTLTAVDPPVRMEWLGRVGPPGTLDGRHRFEIDRIDEGRCRLLQHERLSGILVPLVRTQLVRDTPDAFVAMNRALRREAEARPRAADDGPGRELWLS